MQRLRIGGREVSSLDPRADSAASLRDEVRRRFRSTSRSGPIVVAVPASAPPNACRRPGPALRRRRRVHHRSRSRSDPGGRDRTERSPVRLAHHSGPAPVHRSAVRRSRGVDLHPCRTRACGCQAVDRVGTVRGRSRVRPDSVLSTLRRVVHSELRDVASALEASSSTSGPAPINSSGPSPGRSRQRCSPRSPTAVGRW